MGISGFRGQRKKIKAYRASGHMFAQTFGTGRNMGKGYRPDGIECKGCGYILEWYTEGPCPCGNTFDSLNKD
jgi:hypothetical protein